MATRSGSVETSTASGWGIYGVTRSGDVRLILRFPGPVELEDLATDGRVLINRFTSQTGIRYLAPGAQQERDLSWLDWSWIADLSPDGQRAAVQRVRRRSGSGRCSLSPEDRRLAGRSAGHWRRTRPFFGWQVGVDDVALAAGAARAPRGRRRRRARSSCLTASTATRADSGCPMDACSSSRWSTATTRRCTFSRLADRLAPSRQRDCCHRP